LRNKNSKKQLKANSYEGEVKADSTIHLKKAPKPHGYGGRVTEDSE